MSVERELPPGWERRCGTPCLVHDGVILLELHGDPDGKQAWVEWLAREKRALTPKRMLDLLGAERRCAELERKLDEAQGAVVAWLRSLKDDAGHIPSELASHVESAKWPPPPFRSFSTLDGGESGTPTEAGD
ncbi:MAG TPA: hypothetical protein VM537_25350 [Anaerolineae bacterium]|nr:hypothetical protein [Anaerolineae bacterium]